MFYERSTGLHRLLLAEQRALRGMWTSPQRQVDKATAPVRSRVLGHRIDIAWLRRAASGIRCSNQCLVSRPVVLHIVWRGAPPRGLFDASDWYRGIYVDESPLTLPTVPWDCLALIFADMPVSDLRSVRLCANPGMCSSPILLLAEPPWRDYSDGIDIAAAFTT